MRLLEFINDIDFVKTMCKKMTPPLGIFYPSLLTIRLHTVGGGLSTVTLLQKEPEIQYVALRNINLIIQKRPQVLQNEMKVRLTFLFRFMRGT